MLKGVQSIINTEEPGWRQVLTRVEDNKRIFWVEAVKAWVQSASGAVPLGPNGEIKGEYEVVDIVPPLCDDPPEALMQRAMNRLLH
jgi:hypothetical protein